MMVMGGIMCLVFALIYSHLYLQLQILERSYAHLLEEHTSLQLKVNHLELHFAELQNNKQEREEKNKKELQLLVNFLNYEFGVEYQNYKDERETSLRYLKEKYGYTEEIESLSITKTLSSVPSYLPFLTSLKSLKLANNKISDINAKLLRPLSQLEVLSFGKNKLKDIPLSFLRYFPHLQNLAFSLNHLQIIPPEISYLHQLRVLHLQNNQISNVNETIFQSLSKLEKLDIGWNHLSDLPSLLFTYLPAMKELFIGGNQLLSLPSSFYSLSQTLEVISAANNQLEVLDWDQLLHFKQLTSIDIRDNRLHIIQPQSYFHSSNFPKLKEVYLQGNLCGDPPLPCPEGNILVPTSPISSSTSDTHVSPAAPYIPS